MVTSCNGFVSWLMVLQNEKILFVFSYKYIQILSYQLFFGMKYLDCNIFTNFSNSYQCLIFLQKENPSEPILIDSNSENILH